jgi:hypothetical protein
MTTTTLDATATTFLHHLSSHGLVTAAAASAGITTQGIYKRRSKDEAFATAWDRALEVARDRISASLRQSATDMERAQDLLQQVTDRLRDPELSTDDRATHMRHLEALGQRIDQLKELATSEAVKAHVRRRDEARAKLREDCDSAEVVAAEFDQAVKQLDPAFKRLKAALAAVRSTALRAEIAAPEVAFDTAMRCALHFHAPEFATFLGVLRPDRRHQQDFAKFVAARRPGEVA